MKDFIHQLIQDAGKLALEYHQQLSHIQIQHKSAKDVVTEADQGIEAFIVKTIKAAYPEHSILGEESGHHQGNDYCWVIDPIDGTSSFVHNQPFWSISIALELAGVAEYAAVYGPILGELYEAQKGQGATMNGQKLKASSTKDLDQCILSTGFACLRSDLPDNNLPYFNAIMPKIRDIRRYGSAALDLCYTARGSLDGFWEMNLQPYDIAAGVLILEEAGGKVSDFTGQKATSPKRIFASNGILHEKIIECFQSV